MHKQRTDLDGFVAISIEAIENFRRIQFPLESRIRGSINPRNRVPFFITRIIRGTEDALCSLYTHRFKFADYDVFYSRK